MTASTLANAAIAIEDHFKRSCFLGFDQNLSIAAVNWSQAYASVTSVTRFAI